ncbi:unnamed protein product [Miscanthus lutarioriparius]|uniref:Uncharacterized protein n=1 Tax=Miscanthus lutarioriparius TaxID=422564 RepID=A0A811NQH7_9POAL|nr:unnamed protein product [Miscanthus lutarioriparius]
MALAPRRSVADPDRARLHQLGYKQELKRGLSVVSNFAFSFAIISVLTGVTTTYNTGLRYGGPASMTLGWLVVATFNGCVALSIYGGDLLRLPDLRRPLLLERQARRQELGLAGFLGHLMVQHRGTGMWAGTMSIDFSLAQLVQVIILLGTGGANGGGYMASKYVLVAIYGVILILHGLINCLPIHWLSWFGHLGVFWNTAGVFVMVILLPAVAKERASVEFIFTHFNTENGMGIHDKAYILFVGLLMSQYSLLGYDTSAHMSLGSQVAFQAMVSVATTGLYIAYALPIFFRVTTARKSFVPGTFNLGRYGLAVGWVAVA